MGNVVFSRTTQCKNSGNFSIAAGFIYLLEVIFTFIFPQGFLIALPKIEQVEFSLPWTSIFHNLWWLLLLLLLLFSMFRHYIEMSTKSAAYGLGIYVLWATAAMAIGFGLFFQSQSQWAWLLLIMTISALSTRFFEGIKETGSASCCLCCC